LPSGRRTDTSCLDQAIDNWKKAWRIVTLPPAAG
jgi:hypothetical protein